ncbi:MAG: hypothetical protein JNK87_20850 [Bryobacterales bacterium]|nr:hypothetical protein [Bryobacterales bacterium]
MRIVLALLVTVGVSLAADPVRTVLWRDPGKVEALDLYHGPLGRGAIPKPPFRYVEKNGSGTNEKIIVRDARGRTWEAKLGPEAKPEAFATRLAWALGYHSDRTWLVPEGSIDSRPFRDARFELRMSGWKYRPDLAWTWKNNPFTGRPELNGLRILVMLLSDWDNKDPRDIDSNNGVLESPSHRLLVYFVADWGASLGKWGNIFTREKWDCEGFTQQSREFVKRNADGTLDWAYRGKHAGDFRKDIRVEDVRWLMRYLGRLRDQQIRDALRAAGASPQDTGCFTAALRDRINQLRRVSVAKGSPAPPRR